MRSTSTPSRDHNRNNTPSLLPVRYTFIVGAQRMFRLRRSYSRSARDRMIPHIRVTIGFYLVSGARLGFPNAPTGNPSALQSRNRNAQVFLTFAGSRTTVKMGRRHRPVREGCDLGRHHHGVGSSTNNAHRATPAWDHRFGLHLYRLGAADHLHHRESLGFTASVGAFRLSMMERPSHGSPSGRQVLRIRSEIRSPVRCPAIWLDGVTQDARAPSAAVAADNSPESATT